MSRVIISLVCMLFQPSWEKIPLILLYVSGLVGTDGKSSAVVFLQDQLDCHYQVEMHPQGVYVVCLAIIK